MTTAAFVKIFQANSIITPHISQILTTSLVLVLIAARFMALETSPPGFYIDEAAGATNIICLAEDGHNEAGKTFWLFTKGVGSGFFTPVYLYFGALWVKTFGQSVYAFRAIAAFFTVVGLVGLYCLAKLVLSKEGALLVLLAGALSPWSFQFSRIAWDPPLMPCFVLWGLYFLFRPFRLWSGLLSGAFFSLAMYSYPTARVQVPLLLSLLWLLRNSFDDLKRHSRWISVVISGAIVSSPLIYLTFEGEIQERFNYLSTFSKGYLDRIGSGGGVLDLALIFFNNMAKHFEFNYLFLTGDSNLRHSTGTFGELSWLDTFALACVVAGTVYRKFPVKKLRPLLLFAVLGFLTGIVPAALTWEGLPHALRSIGAWPFLALFTGTILWMVSQRWSYGSLTIVLIAWINAGIFLYSYFVDYPEKAFGWFDGQLRLEVEQAQQNNHWQELMPILRSHDQVVGRYYLIAFKGESCSSSRERWNESSIAN